MCIRDSKYTYQEFVHKPYKVPCYEYKSCLFVKMECQNVKDIQFDISWLEREFFIHQQQRAQARDHPQQYQQFQQSQQIQKSARYDRLVDRGWSHSGCTVLLLNKTDPMKCIEFSPETMQPGYKPPGFEYMNGQTDPNNGRYVANIEEQNKLYVGKWQANLAEESKGEYFSFNREVYNVGSKSDLSFCICLLYTSPSPRDATLSRMPSSA